MDGKIRAAGLAAALLTTAGRALAADAAASCVAIADNTERLACYDSALGRPHQEAPGPQDDPRGSPLSARWELDAEDKQGTFVVRPYKPLYLLLGRISNSPNALPLSANPSNSAGSRMDVSPVEAKYQISFKTKLWEGLFGHHGDLWLGYTQQSSWQVYNRSNSAPFRESDYEPELMAVFRTELGLGAGFKLRMLSLGLNHQSNGRPDPLSRSWNRVVAQAAIERDDFALIVRPWWRFSEKARDDNNPDITRYLGHGDLQFLWKLGEHGLGFNLRGNPFASSGSAQLDWSFPIHSRLKGFVQLFSGYGETLIDYNHRQTTLGVGVSLLDWM